jgi:hypothetical protein
MSINWPSQYKKIDDPSAMELLQKGKELAEEIFGEPSIKIQTVDLRLSEPVDDTASIKRNFLLCELVDETTGSFCIYVSENVGGQNFEGQLAQEIPHLLNAKLYDAYVEGLNTVFAERFLKKLGRDWTRWENHFARGGAPFYKATYEMMREVWNLVRPEDLRSILGFAEPCAENSAEMRINIDAWIASLPDVSRAAVAAAILRHADDVERVTDLKATSFIRPSV